MGLYNFKHQFVPFILDGSKRHTIRSVRRNPDKPGNTLHLYTGLRQPGAQLLFRAPCLKLEDIHITAGHNVFVVGNCLTQDERESLAWHDGFRLAGLEKAFELMMQFWEGRLPFSGHIIHWDYEKRGGRDG